MNMRTIKILGFVLLVLFGAFMVVYGGYDDSPGAQLLGVVAAIGGIVGLVRSLRIN
jgi:drug/metabolite transporter (DMT)-like permease